MKNKNELLPEVVEVEVPLKQGLKLNIILSILYSNPIS